MGGISDPGAYERIRTSNNSLLKTAPLPLGYVRSPRPYSPRRTGTEWNHQRPGPSKSQSLMWLSRPGRIRTDTLQDLNLPPLPLGYGSTWIPSQSKPTGNLRLYHIRSVEFSSYGGFVCTHPLGLSSLPSGYYLTGLSSGLSTPLRRFFVGLSSRTRSTR